MSTWTNEKNEAIVSQYLTVLTDETERSVSKAYVPGCPAAAVSAWSAESARITLTHFNSSDMVDLLHPFLKIIFDVCIQTLLIMPKTCELLVDGIPGWWGVIFSLSFSRSFYPFFRIFGDLCGKSGFSSAEGDKGKSTPPPPWFRSIIDSFCISGRNSEEKGRGIVSLN